MAVCRGRLEVEGIRCFVLDELTVQANNFYSNAIDGVKLQVLEDQAELAHEILREYGYTPYIEPNNMAFWTKLDTKTNRIPFIRKLRVEMRALIMLALIVATPFIFMAAYQGPENLKTLIKNNTWCVDYVTFRGETFQPRSVGIQLSWSNACDESLIFLNDGRLEIPGFNSPNNFGQWYVDGDSVHFIHLDTFNHIFQRAYFADFQGIGLTLRSDSTTIYCRKSLK